MNENLNGEIWKEIEGYEGFYQVSNYGSVRSIDRYVPHPRYGKTQFVAGRILKPGTDGWGYQFVYLCKDGKPRMKKVHRLVAMAFIPNEYIEIHPDINHQDGDKSNNAFWNLSWTNDFKNQQHAVITGLRKCKRIVQFSPSGERLKEFHSARDVYRELGISTSNLCHSLKSEYKTAGGYKWRYAS